MAKCALPMSPTPNSFSALSNPSPPQKQNHSNYGWLKLPVNGSIYLHSGPEGSKLEMLEHNNNVCITFSVGHKLVYQHEKVACSYSMRSESAMCRGQVEFIEEINEKRRALDIIMRHYTDSEFNYSDPAVRNVKVWKVAVRQTTGKVFGLRANEKP